MSATKLASRYAKAILEDSISSNTLDVTKDDLNLIKSACDGSSDLQALLKSPLIKSDVKVQSEQSSIKLCFISD